MLYKILIVSGVLHIIAHYVREKFTQQSSARFIWNALYYFCKPLPILIMAFVVLNYLPAPEEQRHYAVWIGAGLLFSAVGDVLLSLPKDRFVFGLASFFVAHIAYCVAFYQRVEFPIDFTLSALVLTICALVLWLIWSGLDKELKIPVILYIGIIGSMLIFAAHAYVQNPSASTWVAMLGAIFFTISDTVLAVDRFKKPFAASVLLIMLTYYVGQFLIAYSAVY